MASTHAAWNWARFLKALDEAGLAIVKKPTIEKGVPSKPGGSNG